MHPDVRQMSENKVRCCSSGISYGGRERERETETERERQRERDRERETETETETHTERAMSAQDPSIFPCLRLKL